MQNERNQNQNQNTADSPNIPTSDTAQIAIVSKLIDSKRKVSEYSSYQPQKLSKRLLSLLLSFLVYLLILGFSFISIVEMTFSESKIRAFITENGLSELPSSMEDGETFADTVYGIAKKAGSLITKRDIKVLLNKNLVKRFACECLEEYRSWIIDGRRHDGFTPQDFVDFYSENQDKFNSLIVSLPDTKRQIREAYERDYPSAEISYEEYTQLIKKQLRYSEEELIALEERISSIIGQDSFTIKELNRASGGLLSTTRLLLSPVVQVILIILVLACIAGITLLNQDSIRRLLLYAGNPFNAGGLLLFGVSIFAELLIGISSNPVVYIGAKLTAGPYLIWGIIMLSLGLLTLTACFFLKGKGLKKRDNEK